MYFVLNAITVLSFYEFAFLILVVGVIEQYGWFLLIGCILVMYLYNKYKPTLMKMKQNHEDWKEAEINKKGDTDIVFASFEEVHWCKIGRMRQNRANETKHFK